LKNAGQEECKGVIIYGGISSLVGEALTVQKSQRSHSLSIHFSFFAFHILLMHGF